jgi:hypothetical protein
LRLRKRKDFNTLQKPNCRHNSAQYLTFPHTTSTHVPKKQKLGKVVFEFEPTYYDTHLVKYDFVPIFSNSTQPQDEARRSLQKKFQQQSAPQNQLFILTVSLLTLVFV